MQKGKKIDSKGLIEKIRAKAAACKTAKEAGDLYRQTPDGSEAEKIYEDRWIELANLEAHTKAATCKIAEEAGDLYRQTPDGSEAEKIYEDRWMELHLMGK